MERQHSPDAPVLLLRKTLDITPLRLLSPMNCDSHHENLWL